MTIDTRQEAEDNLPVINHNIEQNGCHLTLIEADNYLPAFVYSIGLFQKFGHAEIISFGLNNEVAAAIINHACDLIKTGERLQIKKLYKGFLEDYNIQFLQVAKEYYQDY